jgi:sialate O-acetylesterase
MLESIVNQLPILKTCVRVGVVFYLIFHINPIYAQIKLPRIIRDSMVLQREAKVTVWGWASPKEKVKVTLKNKKYNTVTGADGKWSIILEPNTAGGPHTMEIKGKNTIILKDILFGDVWLCSGQSNMVHQLNIHDVTYAKDIETANYSEIRQFWIPTSTSLAGPTEDLAGGEWKPAIGDEVRPFSAVAYFFAKSIYDEYKIPIGIINASVGGTPIEAWMSEEGFKDFAQIKSIINKNKDTSYINSLSRRPSQPMPLIIDKGLKEKVKWYENEYSAKNWNTIAVPGYWEDQGIKDLNGTVWYRKEFFVPASMTKKQGKLWLGRIVDADEVYINGEQIGKTTYMYPQRRYSIPSKVLKEGNNIITVRVSNNFGKGGFVPDKPYCIIVDQDTIDITGYWKYKVGEVYIPRRGNAAFNFSAQNQPTALYNRMIAPYIQYELKGVLWYQGESNTGKPAEYNSLQISQISDWRQKFKKPDLPFYFVQLPNFMESTYLPSESQWAQFREAQLKSLSIPNTGMAVTIDLGEWNDIHPDNKKDVGERLSLIAKNKLFNKKNEYSGPIFKSAEIIEDKIVLSFDHASSGLMSGDGEDLREFAIAGEDKSFVWATARIVGDKIEVFSELVKNPKYIRYAWADNPDVNFYNKSGLPASPFRTDN